MEVLEEVKSVTLYTVNMDGVYSSIGKVVLTKKVAEDFLKNWPDKYFETFGKAKAHLIHEVKYFALQWKHCLMGVKSLTKKDVDEANDDGDNFPDLNEI